MQDKKNMIQILLQFLLVGLDVLIIVLLLHQKRSDVLQPDEKSLLTQMPYYQQFVLTEENKEQLQNISSYLLYFRSNSCPACQEADEIVQVFLDKNYSQAIPLYFAEANHVASMYEDEIYGIEVTPTLIYVTSEGNQIKAEGSEEIFGMLDEIVRMVTS